MSTFGPAFSTSCSLVNTLNETLTHVHYAFVWELCFLTFWETHFNNYHRDMVVTTFLYITFCTSQTISGKKGVTTAHEPVPSQGIPGNEWPPPDFLENRLKTFTSKEKPGTSSLSNAFSRMYLACLDYLMWITCDLWGITDYRTGSNQAGISIYVINEG